MKLSLIAAVASNKVIGAGNQLPWYLPEDLKNFRRRTMGKPILMGRKTFDSLGRVLPGRINVVVTRNPRYRPSGCEVFSNIPAALQAFAQYDEVMIIGGGSFYEQLLPKATRLYLTVIEKDCVGDVYFPAVDFSQWQEKSREDLEQLTEPFLKYSFRVYQRKPTVLAE